MFPITDWYYGDADTLGRELIPWPGAAPFADNILFNGSHVNAEGGGEYYRVTLQPGKRHRLRLINPSVDNHFTVKLNNHDMTVIANDFVPVNAFTTPHLFMAPGQRFDVTIDASKTPDNYWFNVSLSTDQACGTTFISDTNPPAAIFTYEGVEEGLPTDQGTAPPDSKCEDNVSFTPVLERQIPSESFGVNEDNTIDIVLAPHAWEDVPDRAYWDVHGTDFNISWENPTLEYIAAGDLDFPEKYNVYNADSEVGCALFSG